MKNDYTPDVRRFATLDELNSDAAELIAGKADRCIRNRGIFTLVLAGGDTPRSLYELLAGDEYRGLLPWQKTHLFWGDERCVPPDHKDSNYQMSYESLLSMINIPYENIHRIYGEYDSPSVAAQEYENEIRSFFHCTTLVPSFDVVLLGMGGDGHTASLFPGDSLLHENQKLIAAVTAPPNMTPARRITMTLPLINQADHVFFLVAGKEKREVIDRILLSPDAKPQLPAALVSPRDSLVWFVADK